MSTAPTCSTPARPQRKDSSLDLVVAGTEAAVLMVESEAQQLSEEIMLGAVVFGHEQGNIAINAIHELVRDAGKPVWDWKAPAKDEALIAKVQGWLPTSCAPPTRSATSRPAPRPAAPPTPTS
jgi:polyribonucleotide nucleotidyltransferase